MVHTLAVRHGLDSMKWFLLSLAGESKRGWWAGVLLIDKWVPLSITGCCSNWEMPRTSRIRIKLFLLFPYRKKLEKISWTMACSSIVFILLIASSPALAHDHLPTVKWPYYRRKMRGKGRASAQFSKRCAEVGYTSIRLASVLVHGEGGMHNAR